MKMFMYELGEIILIVDQSLDITWLAVLTVDQGVRKQTQMRPKMRLNSHAFPVMLCSSVVGLHPRSLSNSRLQSSCVPLPESSFNKLSRRYIAEETETNESSDSCDCSGSG